MRRGFTLAEVLITLGIIAAVAALTIPGLIADYQKQALKTQFKTLNDFFD
jgi:prepilin-type N-terminal cleavage/methylation domain-containing protein